MSLKCLEECPCFFASHILSFVTFHRPCFTEWYFTKKGELWVETGKIGPLCKTWNIDQSRVSPAVTPPAFPHRSAIQGGALPCPLGTPFHFWTLSFTFFLYFMSAFLTVVDFYMLLLSACVVFIDSSRKPRMGGMLISFICIFINLHGDEEGEVCSRAKHEEEERRRR